MEHTGTRTKWKIWAMVPLASALACVMEGDDPTVLELEPEVDEAAALGGMEALATADDPVAQVAGFDLEVATDGDDVVLIHAAQAGALEYQLWQSSEPYFTPGEASSTLLSTSADLEHVVAGGATVTASTYWRVVAVGESREVSTTAGAWVQELVPGYGLVGFPLLDTGLDDAESLHAAVPELTEIWHLDAATGGFVIWYGTGEENLSWELGEAVPVRSGATDPVWLRQYGHVPVQEDVATTLHERLNVVTMPLMSAPTTASELARQLRATELQQWNPEAQVFELFSPPSTGIDFAIEPGQGLWIWSPDVQPWPHVVTCGDGVREGGEQCDDGNATAYDGCEDTCERTIAEATTSERNTCVRSVQGDVKCWGSGQYAGNGTPANVGDDEPPASVAPVALGAPAIDISSSFGTTCAVLETGAIRCFGDGSYGALGLGINVPVVGDNELPTAYPPIDFGDLGGASFVQVSVSRGWTGCGLLDRGDVRCWGHPAGLGTNAGAVVVGDDETPAMTLHGRPTIGLPVTELFPSSGRHFARTSARTIRGWGSTHAIQGRGAATTNIGVSAGNPSPADAGDLLFDGIQMTNVDFGEYLACSIQDDGSVYCWGQGTSIGQWGGIGVPGVVHAGGTLPYIWPSAAGGPWPAITSVGPAQVGEPVSQVESTFFSVCAATLEGRLRCWGYNYFGILGRGHSNAIGDDEPPSAGPSIDLGDRIAAFAEGVDALHFCAILEGGALKCWGRNTWGQLGQGHTSDLGDQPGEVGPTLPAVQVF